MRTFAPKQNQPQEPAFSSLVRPLTQRMSKITGEDLTAELTNTSSPRFGQDFSRIPLHSPAAGVIQTKLTINQPRDEDEHEADRVSAQVMRMSAPQLQRTCACGGECPRCQTEQSNQEHERLQTKRVGSSEVGQTEVPPIVHDVLRSPGQALDPAARAFMESRFGYDFSRVRIHSDARAAESAQAVNALAYTAGRHLVFGTSQYSPTTASGRRLLAHELAHSVQQGFAANPLPQLVGNPATALERQADKAAEGVIQNGSPLSARNAVSRASTTQTTWLQREKSIIPDLPPPEEKINVREQSTRNIGCPRGFKPYYSATWMHCSETVGTRFPGCSYCHEGEQEKRCHKILELLGTHRVIAPNVGKCGDKFQITVPEPTSTQLPIDVVKSEIPGGTELDINIDVIRELGLDVKRGRYYVCLKGPEGNDDRLVPSGGSKCQKPKQQPEKSKEKAKK